MNDDRFTLPTDDDEAADPYNAAKKDDDEEDEPSVEEEIAKAEGGVIEKKKAVKDPLIEEDEPDNELKRIEEAAEEIEAERYELLSEEPIEE